MKSISLILACLCSSVAANEVLSNAAIRFDNPRHYALTENANFAKSSFQAEITVTLKGGGGLGCAFFGLGAGKPEAANFDEPTTKPSFFFRLCPSDFAGGQVNASVNGEASGEPFPLGDGTHRLRLTWDSATKRAWLEAHPNWTAGAAFAPQRSMFLPTIAADFTTSHLFAGGSGGVTFADFKSRPLTPAEIAKLPTTDSFANDPSARTWLPTKESSDPAASYDLDGQLKPLSASLRPLVCWYSGATLQASRTLPAGKLNLPGTKWSLAMTDLPNAKHKDARDVTLTFNLLEGNSTSAGVAAAIDFSQWNSENYVLIPAAVYNGNRLRTSGRGYGAGQAPEDLYNKDLPLTQSSVPRLEIEPAKPSKLEVNSSNVTTPAICIFDKKAKRGLIVLAEQAGRGPSGDFLRRANGEILDSAFSVEESTDRSQASIVVSAPGVRSLKPEFIGFSGSPDRGIPLNPGDSISIKLRVFSFPAKDIPALLDRFSTVRKDLTGPNQPRKLFPASHVAKTMTGLIDSRYLVNGDTQFYCPENGPWIAFGWIGGWMNTFPMLVLGDQAHMDRVAHTFDFGLKAQDQSTGYFSYAIRNDGNTEFRNPGKDMTMSRTTGDTLYWMIKQFQLLKAQDRAKAIKPEWEASIRKLADATVATWKSDQQWGKLINYKTGKVSEFNTTGGAMIIGGLALASDYFKNPEYLTVAKEAADFYYQRDFVNQGFTTGGCADILQNADSETAAGFMTALMALYEVTGDTQWLEKSRNLANLVATWTVSHDYELPKFTELGQLGAKLAGVYWASTQNKHGAPGICTTSADALFKLYRGTGDTRYADLLRDIIAAHGESIRPNGRTNERLTFCDAESRGSRGDHVTGWNETNGALMALENPGIYLRTDIDRLYVFDAVEARIISRDASGIKLEIRNPTKFDAEVSIFAENATTATKPQGWATFTKWQKFPVKASETTQLHITPDGQISNP